MNKHAFERLAKRLLPSLPSYEYNKSRHVLYEVPVGNVFRGFLFGSSGFSAEAFYPHFFVQPLYVPADYYVLSFGDRLLGRWDYEEGKEELLADMLLRSARKQGAFRLLQDLSLPHKIARNLRKYHSNPKDPYYQRAVAYSHAISGDSKAAARWLDQCCLTLEGMVQRAPHIEWPAALLEEVKRLRAAAGCGLEVATKLLNEWTECTRQKLGLPE